MCRSIKRLRNPEQPATPEEFNAAVGATSLYNQALGTTSDSYLYDRVNGRPST